MAELKEDLASVKKSSFKLAKPETVKNSIQKGIVFLYMEWMKRITDMDQAIINIIKKTWERKLLFLILIGHIT